MNNPTAGIIIIGNEILSGRTQDANVQFLGNRLSFLGVVVREARIIPDIEEVIIETVRSFSSQYSCVFTTGGIGATHDDITAACIAKSFDKKLVENPQALALLQEYYQEQMNEARRRLALFPEGAELVENSLSFAPGFKIENVFCFAGIPSVMQAMFEGAIPHIPKGKPILQKTITCTLAENIFADELALIQQNNLDIEIGSYPFYTTRTTFGVSLVMRGIDEAKLENVAEQISQMILSHGGNPVYE